MHALQLWSKCYVSVTFVEAADDMTGRASNGAMMREDDIS